MFDPHKNQWWNADNKREAYYMTLRVCYGMAARDALAMVRKNFGDYPVFFNSPIEALRDAISGEGK